MRPKLLVISTTYKTRVALENPCKKRQGIVIGQLKDSERAPCFALMGSVPSPEAVSRQR
jgi:hypothetical protein